ncbi:MAG: toxin-antitoxin system HicB family antitoxin [Gammaproteobacteria bacterium]|nr:toxin-antitoxin system HicB family antitoxin [Gammaproteobacteria bacterium]MCY4339490.1 toxin-antitoxin system HicB family antitoxin [Gammaproteobacteria bacterium]
MDDVTEIAAHKKYTYRIIWSEEDQEFVGLCAEFPSLSWLDPDHDNALRGIRLLVSECLEDMARNKEKIPVPISTRPYSGKFIIRIPPQVHRNLALEAAESGISLNRIISARLAQ